MGIEKNWFDLKISHDFYLVSEVSCFTIFPGLGISERFYEQARSLAIFTDGLEYSAFIYVSRFLQTTLCSTYFILRRRRGRAVRVWTCNPEDPSSSPTLTASWICFTENLSLKSSATFVNSQLVCLRPVGILNPVMFNLYVDLIISWKPGK